MEANEATLFTQMSCIRFLLEKKVGMSKLRWEMLCVDYALISATSRRSRLKREAKSPKRGQKPKKATPKPGKKKEAKRPKKSFRFSPSDWCALCPLVFPF